MVALVHERQYSDRVANVLPDTPNVKTVLVVEDGSDADYKRYGGVEFYDAIAQGSPSATSVSAAPTPSTCSTPAAPPDSPRA